ncbi:class II glutamine amidotransferase [Duganella sp. FT27W]|uniref:class II glutamine amidotransferase n=1 Tax=Duganella sp. FT27W TaxID=2654636 RepID=UPI00128DCE15|nr:class II glutamine amidotransferase [Duganella sp. FT27W]MPQ55498.1 class II glutamine amidotransferase [Duganella sp. FT27W]
MCQLLAMNSSKPAAVDFSFAGFAERGGRTGEHKDGWGVAIHTADGCRLVTDHLASIDSPLALQFRQQPVKAKNVVAHIRKATQGRIALENSHPFTRQLWGRTWSFAHNGNLVDFEPNPSLYSPLGDTDSERAFCHLLSGLALRFAQQPPRPVLFATLALLAGEIAAHGTFNFILSNGELLFAHCSTDLHYVVREYPFSVARLIDCDLSIDFSRHNHLDDRIAVIATQPLTSNETWIKLQAGELTLFVGGEEVGAAPVRCRRQELLLSY